VLCIKNFTYRSPPPVCYLDRGVPPSPQREQRRGAAAQNGGWTETEAVRNGAVSSGDGESEAVIWWDSETAS
jgi:hypothetical protein